MNWYSYTNSAPSLITNTNDIGLDITLNSEGGIFQCMTLPRCDLAVPDQHIRLLLNVSNESTLSIWQKADDVTDSVEIHQLTNSVSIHFMFDGTNDTWRIVSDDKIRSIEDEDHPLAALSGNSIKDQDGNLIQQSGVEVVGITSINGKTPLFTTDTIDADTVNGKTPVFSGDDVTLGEIIADSIAVSDFSCVDNDGWSVVRKKKIIPTAGYRILEIIHDIYGNSYSGDCIKDIYFTYSGGTSPVTYVYTSIKWHTLTSDYTLMGYYISQSGSYLIRHSLNITSSSTTFQGTELTFYV